jgi:hypothetical protein
LKVQTPGAPDNQKCRSTFRNNVVESSYIGDSPVPATSAINAMTSVASFFGGQCECNGNLIIGGRIMAIVEATGAAMVGLVARDNVVLNEAYDGNVNGVPQYGFYTTSASKHFYSGNYVRMKGKPFHVSGDSFITNNIIDNSFNTAHFVFQVVATYTAPRVYITGNYIRTSNSLSTGATMTSQLVQGNHFVQNTVVPISSMTAVGTTVTVTTSAEHGFINADPIEIAGALQPEYNKEAAVISNVTATTFDYTASVAPTVSPATGYLLCSKLKPLGFNAVDGDRDLVVTGNIFEGFYGCLNQAPTRTDIYSVVFSGNISRASFGPFPRFPTAAHRKFAAIDANEPYCPEGTGPQEVSWHHTTATTVGAAGTASALPAQPVGYISTRINGTLYKIPYYN